MYQTAPFVPTEVHVGTVDDENGALLVLTVRTTEGLFDIALDGEAADAIVKAIGTIRSKMEPGT
ncbi:hypothetical protein DPM33_26975 [Mesorhizobium hawassense]|uniref:Uncharacterized protein n=1 Tax=Mesorhizobium hawassense TaxID=1209954 RepID=A0A330HQN6_9HYPH|nr:hypothetical protein [Mesorhizobium hawassense]RAZ86987.1 hypothetical protein DPM33_26975 [Mesorhizobium hawassense]